MIYQREWNQKNNQKILELKNMLESIGNVAGHAEERINKLKDRHLEMIHVEEKQLWYFLKWGNYMRADY